MGVESQQQRLLALQRTEVLSLAIGLARARVLLWGQKGKKY